MGDEKRKPRRYDAEKTRQRILAAAEQEFSDFGIHGARVDRIARAALANKAMIYQYFGPKEALYKAVFLSVYSRVTDQEELLRLGPADIGTMTGTILRAYFDFHQRHPRFWRFLAWENLSPCSGIDPSDLREVSSRVLDHLEALFTKGQQTGHFDRNADFTAYIYSLMAASFFYRSNAITLRGTLPHEIDSPEGRERLLTHAVRTLERGVRTRAATGSQGD